MRDESDRQTDSLPARRGPGPGLLRYIFFLNKNIYFNNKKGYRGGNADDCPFINKIYKKIIIFILTKIPNTLCILVCLCVFMFVCLCICMFVCLCVRMFVWLYVCMFVCLYVCVFVCFCVCMLVCLCVCVVVCLYVYVFVCLCG